MAKHYPNEAVEPIQTLSPSQRAQRAKDMLELIDGIALPPNQPIYTHATDVLEPSITEVSPASASTSLNRPRLKPPEAISSHLSEYEYMELMQSIKKSGNQITNAVGKRINIHTAHIQTLSQQRMEKMKESLDKIAANHWWSLFEKATSSLVSAVSFALGIATLGGGGSLVIGGVLVISGIGPIASLICTELGVWDAVADQLAHDDEERRNLIKMAIPTGIGITCGAISLFGGSVAPQLGRDAFLGVYKQGVSMFVSTLNAASTFGNGLSSADLIETQGELTIIKAALDDERIYLQVTGKFIDNFMSRQRSISAQVKQMADLVIKANQEVVRA